MDFEWPSEDYGYTRSVVRGPCIAKLRPRAYALRRVINGLMSTPIFLTAMNRNSRTMSSLMELAKSRERVTFIIPIRANTKYEL